MRHRVDFLVIGSGVAGLFFALQAAAHGEVLLITKDRPEESNTTYAQGGIAGVFSSEDSIESHVQDTLTAGMDSVGKPWCARSLRRHLQ
jgi:L-aspartate oxidase (EC 1.4.3.16)